jgi:hypothetical protein
MQWELFDGFESGEVICRRLDSVPFIGAKTLLVWLSEVITPQRFATVEKAIAYCGFDPAMKVSAGKVTSKGTRKGNSKIHGAIMKTAGSCVRSHSEPIGQWGYAIQQKNVKGGYGKACCAVGRRLIAALYYVHGRNEDFSYDHYHFFDIEVPNVSIDEMGLSNRCKSALRKNGLERSQETAKCFITGRLRHLQGIGAKCLGEVKFWVEQNKKG